MVSPLGVGGYLLLICIPINYGEVPATMNILVMGGRSAVESDANPISLPLLPTRPMLTLLLSPQFSYPSAFVPLSDDWTWGTIQHSGLSNWVILIPKIWFLKLLHVVPYCSLISEQFLLIFYAVCNFLRFTLNNLKWTKKHFRVAEHWFCGMEVFFTHFY